MIPFRNPYQDLMLIRLTVFHSHGAIELKATVIKTNTGFEGSYFYTALGGRGFSGGTLVAPTVAAVLRSL